MALTDPADATPPETAARLARGVTRAFMDLGYSCLLEFKLNTGRRVDLIGLNAKSEVVIVEIKTTLADYRGDRKWPEYLPYCDRFFFAVPLDFPLRHLPDGYGLIVADGFDAAIRRPAPVQGMNGTRRKALVLRFGLTAAERLTNRIDPSLP